LCVGLTRVLHEVRFQHLHLPVHEALHLADNFTVNMLLELINLVDGQPMVMHDVATGLVVD